MKTEEARKKSLEQQAIDGGGYMQVDLDDQEGAAPLCMIMVTENVIKKLDEIAIRTNQPQEAVLINAILEYDEKTKEKP